MDIFAKQLDTLAKDASKINRGALGSGAGLVADRIADALEKMPVRDDSTEHRLYGATESEKAQIIDNFGIAKFRTSGGKTDTSIGFHGYVETPSKRFNNQVPTGMLMQCINYGTEFRRGTHTVDGAIKAVKNEVGKKMQDYIDTEVGKIMK